MILNNLSIIVAIDARKAIGYQNKLLFHLPDDLKRFKAITTGHTLIMGRKTLLSLPKWPLPHRRHVILSRHKDVDFPGCEVAHSIEEALLKVKKEQEVFLIGGSSIYNEFYPMVSRIYLTQVLASFPADSYFDRFHEADWKERERQEHYDPKNQFHYSFQTLERIAIS